MAARSLPASRWRQIGRTLERLLGRLRPAAPSAAIPPGEPTPSRRLVEPLRPGHASGSSLPCVFVVAIGVPAEGLAKIVAQLTAQSGPRPVFLTDDDHFEIFRRHGAIFEYLPPIEPAPDLDIDLYRLRRLALLRRKWQPSRIIAFGAPAMHLVQLWRASPFEDTRIQELTGGPTAPSPSVLEGR